MLFDMRIYTCRPGTVKAHLELYEKHGLEAQQRHLGKPAFYGITETGPINTFVHVWAYESAADREARRARMQADPQWAEYLRISGEAGYLIKQENRLMTAPSFFDYRHRTA